jgi:O-antigen/teichoic acid export membrane protein
MERQEALEANGAVTRDKRIAHSYVALLFGNFGNKVVGFLTMLTVARFLGADRLGLYTTVFAYVNIVSLVTDLGLSTVVTRRISQDHEQGRHWLGHALMLRWTLVVVTYFIAVTGAFFIYGPDEHAWLIALSALSFLTVPLGTYTAVFQAKLVPQKPMLVGIASKVVLFAAIQLLARSGGSLTALIATEVAIGSASNVCTWLLSRNLLRPAFRLDWSAAGLILMEGFPLFVSTAFVMLYIRVDVFFLEHYRGNTEIGLYAAAYRLTESLPLIASALTNSIFPVMCTQIHSVNEASLNRLLRISLKLLLGLIVPLVLVLSFCSGVVTHVLYGNRFDGSAPLLAILAINQILVYTNILLTTLLVARGRNVVLLYVTLAMLAFNIGINYFVIPQHGALGAAVTTVLTELVGTAAYLILTSTTAIFFQAIGRLLIPGLICSSLLALLTRGNAGLSLTLAAYITAALAAYLGLIGLLHVFDREEWTRLKKLAWQ